MNEGGGALILAELMKGDVGRGGGGLTEIILVRVDVIRCSILIIGCNYNSLDCSSRIIRGQQLQYPCVCYLLIKQTSDQLSIKPKDTEH